MSDDGVNRVAERSRVLVGVDGSKDGLRAVRYAMRAAESVDADLWVVNVVDQLSPMSGAWDVVIDPDILRHAGESAVAEALDVVEKEGFPVGHVTGEVLVGRPGDVLAELGGKARLLVVGRRSYGGLERMFVGSTSLTAEGRARAARQPSRRRRTSRIPAPRQARPTTPRPTPTPPELSMQK